MRSSDSQQRFCNFFAEYLQIELLFCQTAGVATHALGFFGVGGEAADGVGPSFGVAVRHGDADFLLVDVHLEIGIAGADDGHAQCEGFHKGGKSDCVGIIQAADDDEPGFRHFSGKHVGYHALGVMDADIGGKTETVGNLPVRDAVARFRDIDFQFLAGAGEGFEQGTDVAPLLAGGDEPVATGAGGLFFQQVVIKGKVGTPVDELQLVRGNLAGGKRIRYQSATEKKHLVDAPVEKAGESFAQWVGRAADGCVMPHDYGLAVEAECAQQDNQLQSAEGSAIDGAEFFPAEKNFLCSIKHQFHARGKCFVRVHHRVDAVVFQQWQAIKDVSREAELFPLFIAFACEAGMVEVDA